MLRDAGLEVINLELIKTEVLEDLSEFENLISHPDDYAGVFFTSPVAAQVFVDRVQPRLKPALYALGRRATAVLVDAGFAVWTISDANTADEMLTAFGQEEFAGKKLLFVRGERSTRSIPEKVGGIADVDEIEVYRTIEIEPAETAVSDIRRRLEKREIDWACFFSPSAIEAFEKKFGAAEVSVACIGETTAARARELGFKVELVASGATNKVFAKELVDRLRADG